MLGQRVLLRVSSPFNRRPAPQRPSTLKVSSKLPITTLLHSGMFGVKVTLIGPPTRTYSPGPELMTKRGGDALVKPDSSPSPPRPPRPPPPTPAPYPICKV